jgi:hypothetical protein
MIEADDRVGTLTLVQVGALSLSRFESVLSLEDVSVVHAEMKKILRPSGRRIWNVSSTGRGVGGRKCSRPRSPIPRRGGRCQMRGDRR